jgi:malonyl CoA-acyl carrier protein transacylase
MTGASKLGTQAGRLLGIALLSNREGFGRDDLGDALRVVAGHAQGVYEKS